MDVDIIDRKPLTQSVTINEANINTGVLVKNQNIVNNAFYWHKVIVCISYFSQKLCGYNYVSYLQVQNCSNLDREYVLKTITDAVHPLDLIPVFYQTKGNNAYFLVRNCGPAITQLCRQNLIVQNPNTPNSPVSIYNSVVT